MPVLVRIFPRACCQAGRPRLQGSMLHAVLLTLFALCATVNAQDTYQCNALTYAQPGFVSDRRLYPPDQHEAQVWDNTHKVAFQNSDCTWLAANFRDSGSSFVAILFGGFTRHKARFRRSTQLVCFWVHTEALCMSSHTVRAVVLVHRKTGPNLSWHCGLRTHTH